MKVRNLILIAMFGAIWGLIEALAGGAMHLVRVPFSGTIMASVGFAILCIAQRNGLESKMLPIVALVAASFKFLDCLLFNLPPMDVTIINPAAAIAAQGIAYALVSRGLRSEWRIVPQAIHFTVAAMVAMALFNLFATFAMHSPSTHATATIGSILFRLALTSAVATGLVHAMVKRDLASIRIRWQIAAITGSLALSIISRSILS